MVYKIKYKNGSETAERYSSKKLAKMLLDAQAPSIKKQYGGRVVKAELEPGQRTLPSTMYDSRTKKLTRYPKGKPLKWLKIKTAGGYVYRQTVSCRR